jgi:hypothetical protein
LTRTLRASPSSRLARHHRAAHRLGRLSQPGFERRGLPVPGLGCGLPLVGRGALVSGRVEGRVLTRSRPSSADRCSEGARRAWLSPAACAHLSLGLIAASAYRSPRFSRPPTTKARLYGTKRVSPTRAAAAMGLTVILILSVLLRRQARTDQPERRRGDVPPSGLGVRFDPSVEHVVLVAEERPSPLTVELFDPPLKLVQLENDRYNLPTPRLRLRFCFGGHVS